MAKRRVRDLSVGTLFALALIIVAFAVMAVGGESRLFGTKARYQVVFPNADGLVRGSPVKMAGVQVGTVQGIQLPTDPLAEGILVEVGIDVAFADRVREDSRAVLRILQLLSGEKFVEIIPGNAGSPKLPEGSNITLSQDPEFLEQAAVAAENLNDITVSLKNILQSLERGEGLIGQMIKDPEFGKAGLEAVRGTAENLEQLTLDLRRGKGFAGRLLYDREFAGRVDDVGQALEDFSALLTAMRNEEGAIGALLAEGGTGEQALDDLREAAGSLRRVSARLEDKHGLLGRLINDAEYSEKMAQDLSSMTANLAEISEKINRGEGTLGALINERTLHDGMEDFVTGVNDSKFARWLVRRYRKKGIEMEEDAALEPTSTEATP
jgi:phospholipid/cholesterol/gamma-HCH transport system substrate-binding protein